MENNNTNLLLNEYLSNLQPNVLIANFTLCGNFWKELDYTPEFNKLYFIIDGEGWIKIDNEEFYPKPNQMVLLPAGIKQSFSYINNNFYSKYWCHFTATVGGVNLFDIIKLPYIITVNENSSVIELFNFLIENHKHKTLTSAIHEKATLLKLIAFYIEQANIKDIAFSPDKSIEKLNNIIQYIDNNLDKKLTNNELAKIIYMHPNYFIKFFKKYINISPLQYITLKRIEQAKLLLTSTDDSVSNIALTTGFDNPLYFSKTFKKNTGFSPSQFRNLKKHS